MKKKSHERDERYCNSESYPNDNFLTISKNYEYFCEENNSYLTDFIHQTTIFRSAGVNKFRIRFFERDISSKLSLDDTKSSWMYYRYTIFARLPLKNGQDFEETAKCNIYTDFTVKSILSNFFKFPNF